MDIGATNRSVDLSDFPGPDRSKILKIDTETFLYDCFYRWNHLYCIAPPSTLLVWDKFLDHLGLSSGQTAANNFVTMVLHKCNKVIIEIPYEKIIASDLLRSTPLVEDKFPGRKKVLYTLQKDNKSSWIKQWIAMYRDFHSIDTAIIYNNNCKMYTSESLSDELSGLGVEVIVVNIPYKYGFIGRNESEWKYNYLQQSMFEHVRYRYCNADSILINSDIDEVIFSKDGLPLDHYLTSDTPCLTFKGHWAFVSSLSDESPELLSYSSHTILNKDIYDKTKWIAKLDLLPVDAMMKTHHIAPDSCIKQENSLYYIHYASITNGWNGRNFAIKEFDPSKHIAINSK